MNLGLALVARLVRNRVTPRPLADQADDLATAKRAMLTAFEQPSAWDYRECW
jgi:hypothetical protein